MAKNPNPITALFASIAADVHPADRGTWDRLAEALPGPIETMVRAIVAEACERVLQWDRATTPTVIMNTRDFASRLAIELRCGVEAKEGAPRCTGITATWCPVHGECRCDERADGERIMDDDNAPDAEPERALCDHGRPLNHDCADCDAHFAAGPEPVKPNSEAMIALSEGCADAERQRANELEARVRELEAQLVEARTPEPVKRGAYWLTPDGRAELKDTFDNADDGNAVRPILDALEAAEARLAERQAGERADVPECVREWRRSWRANSPTARMLKLHEAEEAIDEAAAKCLEWLAVAHPSAVSRLAVTGDAAKNVRLWRAGQTVNTEALLAELWDAEWLDVNELRPLLRSAKRWAGATFNALPAAWRALADEEGTEGR